MSTPRVTPEVKYELLSHTTSQSRQQWRDYLGVAAFLIAIITVAYLALYLMSLSTADVESDNLDYVMYGPSKAQLDFSGIQQRRAELYAKANQDKVKSLSWSLHQSGQARSEDFLFDRPYARVTPQPEGFKLVCYYALPGSSEGSKELMPEDINATLCTHINMAFAGVLNSTVTPRSDHDLEMYSRVVGLKQINPSLKVLLSINSDMTTVVTNHSTRLIFIRSCLAMLQEHQLDGLDLDWEFPSDPWAFATLLAELREAIGDKYLLTVAVAAPQPIVDISYKINVMARYVNWINLMAYDFHHYTWYFPMTGLNAPLYASQNEGGYLSQLNTNWTVHYWQSQGMPLSKIVVGIPTYGHTYRLVNEENTDIGAPANGFGGVGNEGGFIDYPDVCDFLINGAASVADRSSRVPYAFKDKDWISYDDERSVAYKAEYVTTQGCGGVMIWSLNSDDHQGKCSEFRSKFPLTMRIKNVLTDDQL